MNSNRSTRSQQRAAAASLFTALVFSTTSALAADAVKPKWVVDLEKACEKGSVAECFNLATTYMRGEFTGKKIGKDPALAKRYTERAMDVATQGCRQGNLNACYLLGTAYFEGQFPGVVSDYEKGLEYTRKACVGGYKVACDWLKDSGL